MFPTPYELTKLDIAAIRHADYLHVVYDAPKNLNGDTCRVRATKRREPTERDPFAHDVDHYIAAPVIVYQNWKTDISAARCSSLVYLYPDQITHAGSVLRTLRAGDAIAFRFWPDALPNGNVKGAGLHADVLYLLVYRNCKQVAEYKLDVSVCEDNTARMCRNIYPRKETAEMAQ